MYGVAEEQISLGTRRLCNAWARMAMDKRSSDCSAVVMRREGLRWHCVD